jgi:hypothetical protein
VPFANPVTRDKHFQRHGHKVAARDPAHYEQLADAFMSGAMDADTQEGVRIINGDRIRLHFVDYRFGVASHPLIVRTFYTIAASQIAYRGGCGPYLAHQCARTDL